MDHLLALGVMRQDEFNRIITWVAIASFAFWCVFNHWRNTYGKKIGSLHDLLFAARSREEDVVVEEHKEKAEEEEEEDEDESSGQKARKGRAGARTPASSKRSKAAAAALSKVSVKALLEGLSSGSSGPPSDVDLLDPEFDQDLAGGKGLPSSSGAGGSAAHEQFQVLHDVRTGKVLPPALDSFKELSSELFGLSVWDVVSKKNRLRVMGAVRWTGEKCEAIGLVLWRLQQGTLQLVYIGVAAGERRRGVGRALLRAVRDAARRDELCLSIVALVPVAAQPNPDAMAEESGALTFFRCTGFKRTELKGLDEAQVCFKIEVRKLGKRQRKAMERLGTASHHATLLLWSELLDESRRNVALSAAAVAVQNFRLPPAPKAAAPSGPTTASHPVFDTPPPGTAPRPKAAEPAAGAAVERKDSGSRWEEPAEATATKWQNETQKMNGKGPATDDEEWEEGWPDNDGVAGIKTPDVYEPDESWEPASSSRQGQPMASVLSTIPFSSPGPSSSLGRQPQPGILDARMAYGSVQPPMKQVLSTEPFSIMSPVQSPQNAGRIPLGFVGGLPLNVSPPPYNPAPPIGASPSGSAPPSWPPGSRLGKGKGPAQAQDRRDAEPPIGTSEGCRPRLPYKGKPSQHQGPGGWRPVLRHLQPADRPYPHHA